MEPPGYCVPVPLLTELGANGNDRTINMARLTALIQFGAQLSKQS
jgi:hypothetical protein